MNGELESKTRDLANSLWKTAGDRADQPLQFWLIAESMICEFIARQPKEPA